MVVAVYRQRGEVAHSSQLQPRLPWLLQSGSSQVTARHCQPTPARPANTTEHRAGSKLNYFIKNLSPQNSTFKSGSKGQIMSERARQLDLSWEGCWTGDWISQLNTYSHTSRPNNYASHHHHHHHHQLPTQRNQNNIITIQSDLHNPKDNNTLLQQYTI